MQFSRSTRTLKPAGLLFFGAMLVSSWVAVVNGEVPAFAQESLYSPNAAPVAEVIPTLAADVVILDGGLEQGLRLFPSEQNAPFAGHLVDSEQSLVVPAQCF